MSKKSSRVTSDTNSNIKNPKSDSGLNPEKRWGSVLGTDANKEKDSLQADNWTSIPTHILSNGAYSKTEKKIVKKCQMDSAGELEDKMSDKSGKKDPLDPLASEENVNENVEKTGNKPKRGFSLRKDFLMKFIILSLALGRCVSAKSIDGLSVENNIKQEKPTNKYYDVQGGRNLREKRIDEELIQAFDCEEEDMANAEISLNPSSRDLPFHGRSSENSRVHCG